MNAALAPRLEEATTSAVGPGLIGFLVVALLVVATALLCVSMMRHIKKVPPTFEDPAPPSVPAGEDEPTGGPAA